MEYHPDEHSALFFLVDMLFAQVPEFYVTAFHLCLGQAEAPDAQFLLEYSGVESHTFRQTLLRSKIHH